MIMLCAFTILVFVMMWISSTQMMKMGKEQKGKEMMAWCYVFLFLTVVFALLNIIHLFI